MSSATPARRCLRCWSKTQTAIQFLLQSNMRGESAWIQRCVQTLPLQSKSIRWRSCTRFLFGIQCCAGSQCRLRHRPGTRTEAVADSELENGCVLCRQAVQRLCDTDLRSLCRPCQTARNIATVCGGGALLGPQSRHCRCCAG